MRTHDEIVERPPPAFSSQGVLELSSQDPRRSWEGIDGDGGVVVRTGPDGWDCSGRALGVACLGADHPRPATSHREPAPPPRSSGAEAHLLLGSGGRPLRVFSSRWAARRPSAVNVNQIRRRRQARSSHTGLRRGYRPVLDDDRAFGREPRRRARADTLVAGDVGVAAR